MKECARALEPFLTHMKSWIWLWGTTYVQCHDFLWDLKTIGIWYLKSVSLLASILLRNHFFVLFVNPDDQWVLSRESDIAHNHFMIISWSCRLVILIVSEQPWNLWAVILILHGLSNPKLPTKLEAFSIQPQTGLDSSFFSIDLCLVSSTVHIFLFLSAEGTLFSVGSSLSRLFPSIIFTLCKSQYLCNSFRKTSKSFGQIQMFVLLHQVWFCIFKNMLWGLER